MLLDYTYCRWYNEATTLDIMPENSRGCSASAILHPPSMAASSRQPQTLQCPPRIRLRGLSFRLLSLRPRQPLLRRRPRPQRRSLQGPRTSPVNPPPPAHHQVRCLLVWGSTARASQREAAIGAPVSAAGGDGGVGEGG